MSRPSATILCAAPPRADVSTALRDADASRVCHGVRRHDPAAITEFYRQWFEPAVAMARRATGRDESFALDVVQESMLRCVRGMPVLLTQADVHRWMTRVVYTSAIDLLRREGRRSRREANRVVTGDRKGPTDADGDALAELEKRLADLDEEDRHLLLTRFGLGHTLAQIARRTGSTVGAVHGRIRRLMVSLRQKLREDQER